MNRSRFLLTFMMVLVVFTAGARKINVNGLVTLKGTNEPADGASIIDATNKKFLCITRPDGRFSIQIDSEGELLICYMGTQEVTVPVGGRHVMELQLMPVPKTLDEIVVTAKSKNSTLVTEPTDLDVVGNTLRLKTKVKLPSKMFDTSRRLIVQPAVFNVTNKRLTYMKPVVFDGWRYAVTQERMKDWDKSRDSLTAYQQVKTKGMDNTIYLLDSINIKNPKDDFIGYIMTSLEDYNKVVYTDTFEVARGTVNPLRFLSYQLAPTTLTEDFFRPMPEVELRDTKGSMNLLFPAGKSKLDLNVGSNESELNALIQEFAKIADNPDMSLKSFTINGYASPEGSLKNNKVLAEARLKAALDAVLSKIDPALRKDAKISTNANIVPWSEVARLLREDGKTEEADKVDEIIRKMKDEDARGWAISRLPFYRKLIVPDYLPRLRRVDYNIMVSVYRPMNDEEIAQAYSANPKGLTKYQYYRYYTLQNDSVKEQALRNALAKYPDFVAAATDLSYIMINRDEDASAMLEPFYKDSKKWNKLPESLRLNMGIASMKGMRFNEADEVLAPLTDSPLTHKAKIYAAAQAGRFAEVMDEINADSPLNEVLMLLLMKRNNLAWEKSRLLGNSAVECYVKAVASNRLDNYMEAQIFLEEAFRQDPSLREIAKVDGDVLDLLEATETYDNNEN